MVVMIAGTRNMEISSGSGGGESLPVAMLDGVEKIGGWQMPFGSSYIIFAPAA
jgi:hypothetical protein